jgi:hypothetical protein
LLLVRVRAHFRRIGYGGEMRITPHELTFKALTALDDVLHGAPVTQGLRFALAYLYAVSEGERWLFDQFWKEARRPVTGHLATDFGRRQSLNSAFNGICRAVGIERDNDFEARLRRSRQAQSERQDHDS